jgi:hypothetical protein
MVRLSKPVYWRGRQWAVTGFGIEQINSGCPYLIEKTNLVDRVPNHTWIDHMAEKEWVDLHDFREALAQARKIHLGIRRRKIEDARRGPRIPQ